MIYWYFQAFKCRMPDPTTGNGRMMGTMEMKTNGVIGGIKGPLARKSSNKFGFSLT